MADVAFAGLDIVAVDNAIHSHVLAEVETVTGKAIWPLTALASVRSTVWFASTSLAEEIHVHRRVRQDRRGSARHVHERDLCTSETLLTFTVMLLEEKLTPLS